MYNRFFLIFIFLFVVAISCTDSRKNNSANTFYVNYICSNDTLLNKLKAATSGKASYYDNDKKLQIVSLNYMTEDHPNTHYFKITDELPVKPDPKTIKYEIIFNESMINDSIAYSLKKYIYSSDGWQSKSEMGTIRVFNYSSERDRKLRVIKDKVCSLVIRTIAADTYDD